MNHRSKTAPALPLPEELAKFREFGTRTKRATVESEGTGYPVFLNEFWTSRQRAAHSLHEVSYRACFKPQLPRFFIERLTKPGDTVYDPFMGRGTTLLEASLLGRVPFGNDINPVSRILLEPRLEPPSVEAVENRLKELDLSSRKTDRDDLLAFYHPDTLRELSALRSYFLNQGKLDATDRWIRMVAVNRLTGHSPGFFSVYTMPPNQAVSVESQKKINARRQQTPPYRDVRAIILRKTRALLKNLTADERDQLESASRRARYSTAPARSTPIITAGSVNLVVTSPPFLDVVQYTDDNWLRCWFCGIDAGKVPVTLSKKVDDWKTEMTAVMKELRRALKPGGHVAFEVGEVRGGEIRLEETVIPCGREAGLRPLLVLINAQEFTKTANCWGVANNAKGTNTNRVVVFRK